MEEELSRAEARWWMLAYKVGVGGGGGQWFRSTRRVSSHITPLTQCSLQYLEQCKCTILISFDDAAWLGDDR